MTRPRNVNNLRNFLASVAVAAFCFTLAEGVAVMREQYALGYIRSPLNMAINSAVALAAMFVVIWLLGVAMVLLPFSAAKSLAIRHDIRSVFYWATIGGLVAAATAALLSLSPSAWVQPTGWRPQLIAPPCGLIGGLTYWWREGRFWHCCPPRADH
jgi:hypothetical protein